MGDPRPGRQQEAELWAAAVRPAGRAEFVVAADGRILEWGAGAADVYGYTADDMVGQPVERLIPVDAGDELMALIHAAAADGRLHVTTLEQRSAQGAPIRMVVRAGGVPVEQGEPPRVRVIAQDLDALQFAVQAPAGGAGNAEVPFDLIAEHTYVKDSELVFRYASEAFARSFGRMPDEVVGKTDYDFFPRELADQYRQDDRRVMGRGEPEVRVEEIGRLGPARRLKVPLEDRDGRSAGVLGTWVWLDARDQIRQQLTHWAHLIAWSEDAVIGADPDGSIVSWNPAATRLYGYQADDVRGHSLSVLAPPASRAAMQDSIAAAAAGEPVSRYGAMHARFDGSEVFVDVTMSPVAGREGEVTGISVIVRDATERVRLEREEHDAEAKLQQTRRLESLGILAGGIAHDFNNLLTSILGNASLAAADLNPGSAALERLSEIEQATHRAARLCAQMLAYSGHGRFVVHSVDLSDVVRRATHLLEAAVPGKCVVEYQLGDSLPNVEADESQIRQVLMNLVTNAAEAIGQRTGFLVVHTGLCTADREYLAGCVLGDEVEEGDYVYLEVADTGCGMSPETENSAFDPFFTTKFTGRGLGLAAVLGIVRGHGGAIHVDTQPDAGTRMRVLLPVSASETELEHS